MPYTCLNRQFGENLHLPGSNQSNYYGPVVLEGWQKLPQLTIAEKKELWGKRRVACGGKTLTGEDEDEVIACMFL